MNVIPAGREPCACNSPINQILERLDQMDADIQAAQQAANTAVGTANSQAGVAAASAASAAQDASDALGHAAAAQQSADDALLEATNAAGSAQDAADDLADALLAVQNIEATIASVLANDIGAKVDKLNTTGFHLYTHNGSTQGEVAPDINPTAATIPIRDSAGKLFGADPTNGATDKTLTTANWVSQTGDSAPNNLIHKSGNETASGIKAMWTPYYIGTVPSKSATPNDYMDLGRVFSSGSFGNITLNINGRGDYFIGVLIGSHDADTDTISSSYDGIYSTSNKLGLYFAKLADGIHLLIRRETSAGQGISITVFNIGNVTAAPVVTPSLTYSTITITTEPIDEIVII